MRIQFVLSEKSHINSFIYCLKTLHGNFVEVLFNFSRSGLSLSQFWEDKNTDRGKYFFFLNSSCFSRITGPNENVSFRMNVKDVVNRLRLHKKDVKNEPKNFSEAFLYRFKKSSSPSQIRKRMESLILDGAWSNSFSVLTVMEAFCTGIAHSDLLLSIEMPVK